MSLFFKSLELRFDPSTYENHQAQVFMQRHHGSVSKYQVNLEKMGNRVPRLPPYAILNCFISGLIPKIRNELSIQRPYSISQVMELTKLIDGNLKENLNSSDP